MAACVSVVSVVVPVGVSDPPIDNRLLSETKIKIHITYNRINFIILGYMLHYIKAIVDYFKSPCMKICALEWLIVIPADNINPSFSLKLRPSVPWSDVTEM